MGSWVPGKAPLEHLLLSSNPAIDTTPASVLSHPHSPASWLMISLSFDVLMKSFGLSWMTGPLLANYSIKCKWRKKRDWSYYFFFPLIYISGWICIIYRHGDMTGDITVLQQNGFCPSAPPVIFSEIIASSPVLCSHSQPRERAIR